MQIISCLANLARLGRRTILVSLLQPAPETWALFDDVLLLSEGAHAFGLHGMCRAQSELPELQVASAAAAIAAAD